MAIGVSLLFAPYEYCKAGPRLIICLRLLMAMKFRITVPVGKGGYGSVVKRTVTMPCPGRSTVASRLGLSLIVRRDVHTIRPKMIMPEKMYNQSREGEFFSVVIGKLHSFDEDLAQKSKDWRRPNKTKCTPKYPNIFTWLKVYRRSHQYEARHLAYILIGNSAYNLISPILLKW